MGELCAILGFLVALCYDHGCDLMTTTCQDIGAASTARLHREYLLCFGKSQLREYNSLLLGQSRCTGVYTLKCNRQRRAQDQSQRRAPWHDRYPDDESKSRGKGVSGSRVVVRQPLKTFGLSEEVADVLVFLAGNEASFMTWAEVAVDGGWYAA